MEGFSKHLKLYVFFILLGLLISSILSSFFAHQALFFGMSIALIGWIILSLNYQNFVLKIHEANKALPTDLQATLVQVEKIARRAGVLPPQIVVCPSFCPNAFSVSRRSRQSTIVLTEGLLSILSTEEIEAVLAYEIAALKTPSHAITAKISVLAWALSRGIYGASLRKIYGRIAEEDSSKAHRNEERITNALRVLWGLILVPVISFLQKCKYEAKSIYELDAQAVAYCGTPSLLASALRKISAYNLRSTDRYMHPAFSSLYFVNPFRQEGVLNVMGVHPEIVERLKKVLVLHTEN